MIVFPMAGLSSRFRQAGYEYQKFRLKAFGRTLFEHSVVSFSHYFGSEKLLFVTQRSFYAEEFIRTRLRKLGLQRDDYHIIQLEKPTSGQAETVLLGLKEVSGSENEPLSIFNIDTFRPDFRYPENLDLRQIDGYLEVFEAAGDHWSFVLPEAGDDTGRVLRVTEKERISDLCSTGLYYFKTVSLFRRAYDATYVGTEDHRTETYVAPMYNYLLESGKDIRFSKIDISSIVNCGTPDEYLNVLQRGDLPTNQAISACERGFSKTSQDATNFDLIASGDSRVRNVPLGELGSSFKGLGRSFVPELRVLDYHGSFATLFYAPQGAISRHGLHPDKSSVIEETTQAAINADQRDEQAPNVIRLSQSALSRPAVYTVGKGAAVSASWDSNYQHFLVETLSRIEALDGLLEQDVVFCVTDVSFAREMVAISYPNRKFLFLNNNDLVKCEICAYGLSPTGVNMTHLSVVGAKAIRKLRSNVLSLAGSVLSSSAQCFAKSVYIGRKTFSENHGNARVMLNESDVIALLSSQGFITLTFEGLTLCEKAILLAGRKEFLTPVGANLMNLIFATEPYKLGIIAHTVGLKSPEFFRRLLTEVGSPIEHCVYLDCSFAAPDREPTSQQSYFVDCGAILDYLTKKD